MQSSFADRVADVHRWQHHYKMVPRGDSELTKLYAESKLPMEWTASVVARELVATNFIYEHSLYGEVIEEFLREVAARIRKKYRLSWSRTWDIVKFYGPIALKLICVQRGQLTIPNLNEI